MFTQHCPALHCSDIQFHHIRIQQTITRSASMTQIVNTKTKGLVDNTASLHIACHVLSSPIIICSINGSLSTFLEDVLAMKLFEAQDLHINVWSHWIHFLYVFTLSQTGLEKAVGDWCLAFCAQGGFYFPFFVLVTDLGTADLEQHALVEKVICMLMYLPVLFAHFQLFVWTTRQQCFFIYLFKLEC